MSKEKTTTDQHSNLRKRLQDELSYLRSTIESNDVDWFLKSSNLSNNNNLTPIKSPSMENSNNSKAPPSLSTTNANVLSTSPTAKPSYSGVPLQRSKTADARYSSSLSKSTTNSSSNSDFGASSNKLSRTATNITTYLTTNSDIKANTNTNANSNSANRRRTTSFSDSSSSTKKKGGFFKRLLGKSSNDDDSNGSSPSNTATSSNASSRRTSIAAPSNNNNNIPSSPTSHHLPLKKSIDGFVDPIEQKTSTFDNKAKSTIERKNSKNSSSLEKKSTSSSYSQTASTSSTTSSSSPYSFQIDDTMDEKLAQYLKDIELYKDETDPCPYKPDTPAMDPSQRIQNRIAEALPHPSVLAAESSTNSLSSSDKELDDLLPKFDKLPIPPHPDRPKLPSALTKHPKFNTLKEQDFQSRVQLQLQQHQAELLLEKQKESSGVFGSILGRRKTITSTPNENDLKKILSGTSDSDASVASSSTNLIKSSDGPIVYAKPPVKKDRRPPIKILNELPPMKKVAFATTTFVYDPPQQIPSRNPRKGNVEIGAHGELIIHKLSDEDKLNTSSGIVVGGSGHLRLVSEEKMVTNTQHQQRVEGAAKAAAAADAAKAAGGGTSPSPSPSTEESTSSSSIGSAPMKSSSSNASFDHTINISDRVKAAQRAHDDSTHGSGGIQNGKMTHLHIDKPMIRRRKSKSMDKPLVTLKIDELYTRCCHLREILPIPATLKQIPKGSTDPLPILQLRNPKPSMIEVLSFSDFIRVAPIVCVSLDGVNLTTKMFRIILSALLNKRYLEKLSLRNTPINQDGWKLLCWFLSMNKSLKRLDITQCSSLHLNTQRLRPSSNKTASSASNPAVVSVKTMVGNTNDRSDMDWSLLSASIIYRGGIEEIILTGCKINDLIVFKSFLNYALTLKTLKIGLAYNELSYNQCEIIAQWLSRSQKILGIDLGFNDFSNNNLKPFIEFAKISLNSNLSLISFSNCNLNDNEDTNHIFDLFSRLPNLKYLDISN
ncbi:unnamed protein product [[Candida] boidinii]|nr:unnamed protein product [[Candida] boidinii]